MANPSLGRLLAALLALNVQRATMSQHWRRQLRRALPILLSVAAIAFLLATLLWTGDRSVPETQQEHKQQEQPQQQQQQQQQHQLRQQPNAWAAPWEAKRADAKLLIPRRIHHYFSTSSAIPARLVQEINSWASNHRDYDIYYWDAVYVERHLLVRPEYAKYQRYYWNGTQSRYERDLIAKLLVLHQYGGIVPDLNMRSLREATDYLTDSSCLVAQDRVEKAVFSLGLESLPSLAFAACRPGHHFLSYFLRKVTEVPFRTGAVVLDVATTTFLVHVFNAAVAAFDEECGAGGSCDFRDRVALAEPHVFLPVIESGLFESFVSNCQSRAKMPFLQKEACYNLDVNGNLPTPASLAMPVYKESWAPNKDRPTLPLTKIGPSAGGRKPIRNLSLGAAGVRSVGQTPRS